MNADFTAMHSGCGCHCVICMCLRLTTRLAAAAPNTVVTAVYSTGHGLPPPNSSTVTWASIGSWMKVNWLNSEYCWSQGDALGTSVGMSIRYAQSHVRLVGKLRRPAGMLIRPAGSPYRLVPAHFYHWRRPVQILAIGNRILAWLLLDFILPNWVTLP